MHLSYWGKRTVPYHAQAQRIVDVMVSYLVQISFQNPLISPTTTKSPDNSNHH
jgi:hypothetical protein